jgi:uncharacterized protein
MEASERLNGKSRNDTEQPFLLNMVAGEADANRKGCAELVREYPEQILNILREQVDGPTLFAPRHHPVLRGDVNYSRLEKIVLEAHEYHPADFKTLLGTPKVGPATIRSLALISELIYDAPISRRDPTEPRGEEGNSGNIRNWADYSFAHGGKDGFPYPVDRPTYDGNIAVLTDAVRKARIGQVEKMQALKRLSQIELAD